MKSTPLDRLNLAFIAKVSTQNNLFALWTPVELAADVPEFEGSYRSKTVGGKFEVIALVERFCRPGHLFEGGISGFIESEAKDTFHGLGPFKLDGAAI